MAHQRRCVVGVPPHDRRPQSKDRGSPHRQDTGAMGDLISERISMPDQPYLQRISRKRIDPPAVTAATSLPDLIDQAFLSYNGGRLREACQTFVNKALADDGTV